MIGLGGGEFRLPVLMHGIGFDARSAIPLNLLVSLVTLTFAFLARGGAAPAGDILTHWPEIAGLAAGGGASAIYGAGLVRSLTTGRLTQLVALLLAALGVLMLAEAAYEFQRLELVPDGALSHVAAGVLCGLLIGLISSILGVAGGELLIPALVFLFGLDIKMAGSASILVSLAVVSAGLLRYWRLDAFPKGRGVQRIVSAMSAGSIIGAVIGGLAVAFAPVQFLKVLLGCVLIVAPGKTIVSHRKN